MAQLSIQPGTIFWAKEKSLSWRSKISAFLGTLENDLSHSGSFFHLTFFSHFQCRYFLPNLVYNDALHVFKIVGFSLQYASSSMNPIALFFLSTSFKAHYKKLFYSCLKEPRRFKRERQCCYKRPFSFNMCSSRGQYPNVQIHHVAADTTL